MHKTLLSAISTTMLLATGTPLAGSANAAPTHAVQLPFQGAPSDGSAPDAGLIYSGGVFYGTTNYGGSHNNGTIFQIVSGVRTTLHSFDGTGTGDGAHPQAGLILLGNYLYGTTRDGGTHGAGAFYRVKLAAPNYNETVLYSFGANPNDGRNPLGTLIKVGSLLYGTTVQGGNLSGASCSTNTGSWDSCGTVYSMTLGGVETVLHPFTGGSDGANPYAGLLYLGTTGLLYGTTSMGGGSANCAPNTGCGTVFSVPLAGGSDQILHPFAGGSMDGSLPYAGSLIKAGTNLYGTTFYGGAHSVGTIYQEPVVGGGDFIVHNFCQSANCVDGEYPTGGLINVGSVLYGTAYSGGTTANCSFIYTACGTAFEVKVNGNNFQPTSFIGGSDGGHPYAEMIEVSPTLFYGTTEEGGGSANCTYPPYSGCGTIFTFTP